MSCSSAAPNDLSFVVYTNSREDYRVTVRSTRACMVGAERLVDEVARDCGDWLTNDFSALVGVVPSPDRPGNWLGFRVFDAGQFMDRPHTLAVVAVEVPQGQRRSWKIAQLLAALSPPVPDSSGYQLPTEIEVQFAAVVDEPFKSLFGWEQRQSNRCEQHVVFSKPANIPLQLNQRVRSLQAQTGKLNARVAGLLCVAFVALTGLWWIFNEGHVPKSPPSSRYSREELVSVLADSGATLLPAVDFEHARVMVVVSANLLNDRLDELAKGLTMRRPACRRQQTRAEAPSPTLGFPNSTWTPSWAATRRCSIGCCNPNPSSISGSPQASGSARKARPRRRRICTHFDRAAKPTRKSDTRAKATADFDS